jgi:hypothetical protein
VWSGADEFSSWPVATFGWLGDMVDDGFVGLHFVYTFIPAAITYCHHRPDSLPSSSADAPDAPFAASNAASLTASDASSLAALCAASLEEPYEPYEPCEPYEPYEPYKPYKPYEPYEPYKSQMHLISSILSRTYGTHVQYIFRHQSPPYRMFVLKL